MVGVRLIGLGSIVYEVKCCIIVRSISKGTLIETHRMADVLVSEEPCCPNGRLLWILEICELNNQEKTSQ